MLSSNLHSKHILSGGRGDAMPAPLICLYLDMTAIPCSPHVLSALYLLWTQTVSLYFFLKSLLFSVPLCNLPILFTYKTTLFLLCEIYYILVNCQSSSLMPHHCHHHCNNASLFLSWTRVIWPFNGMINNSSCRQYAKLSLDTLKSAIETSRLIHLPHPLGVMENHGHRAKTTAQRIWLLQRPWTNIFLINF